MSPIKFWLSYHDGQKEKQAKHIKGFIGIGLPKTFTFTCHDSQPKFAEGNNLQVIRPKKDDCGLEISSDYCERTFYLSFKQRMLRWSWVNTFAQQYIKALAGPRREQIYDAETFIEEHIVGNLLKAHTPKAVFQKLKSPKETHEEEKSEPSVLKTDKTVKSRPVLARNATRRRASRSSVDLEEVSYTKDPSVSDKEGSSDDVTPTQDPSVTKDQDTASESATPDAQPKPALIDMFSRKTEWIPIDNHPQKEQALLEFEDILRAWQKKFAVGSPDKFPTWRMLQAFLQCQGEINGIPIPEDMLKYATLNPLLQAFHKKRASQQC